MLVERLDLQHGLLDHLMKEGVVSKEERQEIEEPDNVVARKHYESIPKEQWPQLRRDEQMKISNGKMLECLKDKKYVH